MAIYHCTTKPISRSAGRSAVAAAAYRSGEAITDQRTGNNHDYTKRQGVVAAVALLPTGESCNRSELWNAAEAAEKRKDARTAREWVVALPSELSDQERLHLATGFAVDIGKRFGVAIDLAIHLPDKEGDQRNHHAHILTTTRKVEMQEDKLVMLDKATIELSDKKRGELKLGKAKEEVKRIRELWAGMANSYLKEAGHAERIDHRSLKEQGIAKVASVHLGPTATQMERNGKASDRGDLNREANKLEAEIIDLKAERTRRINQAKEDQVKNNPDQIKLDYKKSIGSELKTVTTKAKPLHEKARTKLFRAYNHWHAEEPARPSGALGFLKKKAHEQWAAAKAKARKVIRVYKHREEWLKGACHSSSGYQSVADKLARARLERANPELCRQYDQVRKNEIKAEQEKRSAILERQAEKRRSRKLSKSRGLER